MSSLQPPGRNEHSGLRDLRSGKTALFSTMTWFGLGLTAVALIAVTAGLVWRSERQIVNLQHAHAVGASLQTVLADLEDAEAREGELLITGEPSFLEPYDSSRKALDEEFDRLRELVRNNSIEQKEVERLHFLVYKKLDDLQAVIDVRAKAGFEAARATILTRRGKQLMELVRQDINTMEEEEQITLAGSLSEWRLRLRTSLATLVGSALLMGCCLLIGRIAFARSASHRQRAEEALAASGSRFETLCEQAPVGIYETDAEGLTIYTNRRWSAMSGLSANESLGHGWAKALHPDDRATIFEGWQKAAQHGTTWEYRLLTGRGETRWIRAVGGPIYSARDELTGYVGTVEDVTERKQAEESRKQAENALRESRQELRALAGRLFLAQEEERKRISRELHDDLSQKVALLSFDASSLVLAPPAEPAEMKKSLCKLQTRIAALAIDVRQIAHQLHPSILEDLGLGPALRELCEEFSARTTIQASFEEQTLTGALPLDVASCVYRVAQEALHNVQKHARGASHVRLTVGRNQESICLYIEDDGVGFSSDAGSPGQGLGIISMKERVRLVQGEFSIHSEPGKGTTVTVCVPLPRRTNEAHAPSQS